MAVVERLLADKEALVSVNEVEISGDKKTRMTLLHACVTELESGCGTSKPNSASAGRLRVVKYILSRSNPSVDLAAVDGQGRTVLQLAARCNDAHFISALESCAKSSLNLNEQCRRFGWTALHYGVDRGSAAACRVLLQAGASQAVHAGVPNSKEGGAKPKGPTPLELANQRLRKPPGDVPLPALEAVIAEFSRVAEEAARQIQLMELAEAKREKEVAAQRAKEELKAAAAGSSKASQEKKQKSVVAKDDSKVDSKDANKPTLPVPLKDPVGNEGAPTEKKKRKKTKKKGDPVLASDSTTPTISPDKLVPDNISRDEMLEHLLNMGFEESACLAAISACGNNIDMAISWIVERPEKSPPQKAASQPPTEKSTPAVVPAASKEDLRRINRAWNVKAEDELKKFETERKQREQAQLSALRQKQELPHRSEPGPSTVRKAEPVYGTLDQGFFKVQVLNVNVYPKFTVIITLLISCQDPFSQGFSTSHYSPSPRRSTLDHTPTFNGSVLPTPLISSHSWQSGGNNVFHEAIAEAAVQPVQRPSFPQINGGGQTQLPNIEGTLGANDPRLNSVSSDLEFSAGAIEYIPLSVPGTPYVQSTTGSHTSGGLPPGFSPPVESFSFSDGPSWLRTEPKFDEDIGGKWTPSIGNLQSTSIFGGLAEPLHSPGAERIVPDGLFSGLKKNIAAPFSSLSLNNEHFDLPFLSDLSDTGRSLSRLFRDGDNGTHYNEPRLFSENKFDAVDSFGGLFPK